MIGGKAKVGPVFSNVLVLKTILKGNIAKFCNVQWHGIYKIDMITLHHNFS